MKIVIAPDKFKGALSAEEAAECIARGLRETFPEAECDLVPLADGGEGTAEVLGRALGASCLTSAAHDALGRRIDAEYAWIDQRKMAIFDMSEVAGLGRLSPNPVDLDNASTRGVGEMILAAVEAGAREIMIGLGGSMTNDGGFGMARALGWRFLGEAGEDLSNRVSSLATLANIDGRQVAFSKLKNVRLLALADVENPLLGPDGAAHTFAAQKGATDEQIQVLEEAMARFADVVEHDFGVWCRNRAGAGAAGGLGFGLMAFCGAEVRSGFDIVAEATGLEDRIREADVVVTGEGRLDRQTLAGKGPGKTALLGRRLGKTVLAVVGKSDGDPEVLNLFDRIFEVAVEGRSDAENFERARELLHEGGRAAGKHLLAAGQDLPPIGRGGSPSRPGRSERTAR